MTTEADASLHPKQTEAFLTPANEVCFGGAKGGGKAATLDTFIPTPTGWKRNGELEIGDDVLGEDGWSVAVIGVSEVITTQNAYRLTLSDGTSVVVGEDHLWKTMTANDREASLRRNPEWRERRKATRESRATGKNLRPHVAAANARREHTYKDAPTGHVRTTKEIHESLYIKRGVIVANHSIANHKPLTLPKVNLVVPPYTLGAWLGDGTAISGEVAGIDEAIFQEIENDGFEVTKHKNPCTRGVLGLGRLLRGLGVRNNKHIPVSYLRAAFEQRLAVLHGLMDTDGWCEKDGSCKIALTKKALFDGVVELIRTFGITVNVTHGRKSATNGRPGNTTECWTACFVSSIPVFRLKRKLERQNTTPNVRYSRRFIVASELLGALPMRCIQVASPDGMYLAGESFIPTHNSFLLRIVAIQWCMRCPGIQVYLFRRKYPDLIANHMRGSNNFHQLLARKVKERECRIVGDKDIRWKNDANIFLRHLQNENDVTNYQGVEIHVALFDELTHFSEYQYRVIRSSVRLGSYQPPRRWRSKLPRIVCGTNPGSLGHHWVKQAFIDNGAFTLVETLPEEGGMVRQFIPARAEDNPDLLKNDPAYLDRLEGLGDPAMVKAMREGDWNVVAGSMFGDKWRVSKSGQPWHVLDKAFPIPASWEIWRGGDDGYAAPAAIYWLTRNPDTGTIYVIREIYQTGMLPDDLGRRILKCDMSVMLDYGDGDYDSNDEELSGEMDSAAFADTGTGKPSRGAQMNALGCRWTPSEKPPGSRVMRVQLMHQMLSVNKRDPNKLPGIRFFPSCVNAIRTIPTLPVDDKNPEDVDTEAEDHSFDAITTGAARRKKAFTRPKVSV